MQIIFKDEAIVLKRFFVGEKDAGLIVYSKKSGRENIFMQNGQIIKNLPIISITEFSWFSGIFYKTKDKIYFNEVDRFKNLAINLVKNYNKLSSAYNIINWIYNFAPHPDEKIFFLVKKTLYYLTISEKPQILELAFLLRLAYLNGELNINRITEKKDEKSFLKTIFETNISNLAKKPIQTSELDIDFLKDKVLKILNH